MSEQLPSSIENLDDRKTMTRRSALLVGTLAFAGFIVSRSDNSQVEPTPATPVTSHNTLNSESNDPDYLGAIPAEPTPEGSFTPDQ